MGISAPAEATGLFHEWIADSNFLQLLYTEDIRNAAAVKAAGCPDCGGRLDRADYPRKPRGGYVAAAGERFERRLSLCCAQDGCRHRLTPPSLVFLGRRVYLAITVVIAAWRSALRPEASPPQRTVRRWRSWFAALTDSRWWMVQRGQLWPLAEPGEHLPAAVIEPVMANHTGDDAWLAVLRILRSVPVAG